jgi:hypothetical protein
MSLSNPWASTSTSSVGPRGLLVCHFTRGRPTLHLFPLQFPAQPNLDRWRRRLLAGCPVGLTSEHRTETTLLGPTRSRSSVTRCATARPRDCHCVVDPTHHRLYSQPSKGIECPPSVDKNAPASNETTGSRTLSVQLSGSDLSASRHDPNISVPAIGAGRTPVIAQRCQTTFRRLGRFRHGEKCAQCETTSPTSEPSLRHWKHSSRSSRKAAAGTE